MAKLDKVASLMNIDMKNINSLSSETNKEILGQKRRAWLATNSDNSIASKDIKEKGSIKPPDESDLTTRLIDGVDQSQKYSKPINGIYKPLSLTFKDLRSNPLKIIAFLFTTIEDNNTGITAKITVTEILRTLGISKESTRTALRFLLKNKVIKRVNFKIGKNGWSQYQIKESILYEIETGIKKGAIKPFNRKVEDSSSIKGGDISSRLFNTTTDITINPFNWEAIDISPLSKYGFTRNHILQVQNDGKLTLDQVQDSIHAFAFDLEKNNKLKDIKNPLAYFMSTLRKGIPFAYPDNYVSPEIEALRKFNEAKQRIQGERAKLEQEAQETAFTEWLYHLNETTIAAIVDPSTFSLYRKHGKERGAVKSILKAYFQETEWPSLRLHILQS